MSVVKALTAGLLILGLFVSCGNGDESSVAPTSTTTTSEASTTATTEAPTTTTSVATTTTTAPATTVVEDFEPPAYQIERAVEFIGQELTEPPEGFGNWAYFTTVSRSARFEAGFNDLPRVVYYGATVLAGQLPYPGEDAPYPLLVTDGVRLTIAGPGDGSLYLRAQCPAAGGVGAVALMWRRPDASEVALELWDYDPETSQFVELDPDTFVLAGCAYP